MNKPIALVTKLTVSADLKTIIRYHPASAIYSTNKNAEDYKSTFQVKLLAEQVNGEQVILPDYRYADIVDRTLPDPSHENTLLVMVKNMIELEWGYFKTYYIIDETGAPLNLHTQVTSLLQDLKVLVAMAERKSDQNVIGKLDLKEMKGFGERDKAYVVKDMQVNISDQSEANAIIDLLICNRIKELSKPEYYFYNFYSEEFTEFTIEQIQAAIDRMKQPFRDYRARWLFCKFVSETVLAYLKGEMQWHQGDVEITQEQGVFIHTLLVLFHLLEPEQELKNKTDRDKAKYIRSFFRKDLVHNNEEFIRFTEVTDYTDFKFDENQWFKVTQI